MVHRIVYDGPLLIFCQLGYLATSTIPHHRSGLERKDIERVLHLQHELILDQLLPLNGASDTVWEDLRQLRKQVEGLCGAISGGTGDTGNAGDAGEEGELLQTLLRRIDDVRNLRVVTHGPEARSEPSGTTSSERASATSQNYNTVLPRMFVIISHPAFPLPHNHRPSPSTSGTRRLRANTSPSRPHSHLFHPRFWAFGRRRSALATTARHQYSPLVFQSLAAFP
ncbi:hypothetical protein BGY98DRAFT_1025526 [Russula aff. rugulosa BPL654]|nr:hypothetical protein BGY98DRAFT_1025526 [Russula aff. rugulosa BPL654]